MLIGMTELEITVIIEAILGELLRFDANKVIEPTDTLGDIGIDSPIWYLGFQCELAREFGIRIADGEFFPSNKDGAAVNSVLVNGRFTEEGVKKVKERFWFGDFDRFEKNPTINEFFTMYTVGAVVRYIGGQIGVVPSDQPVHPPLVQA